ncbi:nucleotide pyrophosphohydrolase [Marinitoga sp. 1135]|uniref:Protein with tetrapyrrole methyltransferase and pyrophosphatase domains n=1 Tax=Marinitoga piezophila (strain DSM 14283 / JCM 11233 / KA3) TaxID=443254 RepID=H2J6Z8_MARPK|nr:MULTISPECIES: MazG nucleotide pyrophosphohydrolase domain-containing protein [Marinitoga]AEX85263.1 protein with tetrapyrrole methyltransferase and pyrophosphatase domains [Marinitoga piezophila KA3]APT75748.1 nucleotide pyrophosphohydrolase [Marinitoga sp. 1137]NUU95491.1 nucleotide pyrophosphohydrolase [Marinitoga sp. 1135]NUU97418.1 nucleotide pyrophosphohydrolase [Marinitoga sp. 1138]
MDKKFLEEFKKLYDIVQRNIEKCPWISSINTEYMLNETESEINEIREAIKNEDIENLEEEIGDLIYDAFLVLKIAERDYNVSSEKIINGVVNKISNRKPWLFWDKPITKEEASKIWKERKEAEKREKNKKL